MIGFSHSAGEKIFKIPKHTFASPPITSFLGLEFSPTAGDALCSCEAQCLCILCFSDCSRLSLGILELSLLIES